MDANMYSKIEDFLTDDDFINYVLGVDPQSAPRWETYFSKHPECKVVSEEAKTVLLAPENVNCDFSVVELINLKNRIIDSING